MALARPPFVRLLPTLAVVAALTATVALTPAATEATQATPQATQVRDHTHASAVLPMAGNVMREPERYAPLVQITEIAVDTVNEAGVDGYEFVEVVNVSDAPQDWNHLRLRYVYALVDFTSVAHTVWPIEGRAPVLQPGQTLVLWVVSDATEHLTAADFNAVHGSDLVEGEDLVRVRGAGLANGSMRGVEVATAAGVSVSRAYYNADNRDDAVVGKAAQYGFTDDPDLPQPYVGLAPTSPGVVGEEHRAHALVDPGAGRAPVIVHEPRGTFAPGRQLRLSARVSEDHLLRAVTLELAIDGGDVVTRELPMDLDRNHEYMVPAASTVAARELSYRFVAWDGHHQEATEWITAVAPHDVEPVRLRATDDWQRVNRARVGTDAGAAVQVPPTAGDGNFVTGAVTLVAAAGEPGGEPGGQTGADATIAVDGDQLATVPALEHPPVFAFEATLTDAYFRNGVKLGDEVLHVFDEGYYSEQRTVETLVPLEAIAPGESFSLRVYAGTKAQTAPDPDEQNDDFEISNLRLVLPNGTELRPAEHSDPTATLVVGDGAGAQDFIEATFVVPPAAFTAHAAQWDTVAGTDGEHAVSVSINGVSTSTKVRVDNTAPSLTTTIAPGREVRGEAQLDVVTADAGAGLDTVSATLNGRAVVLPLTVSSLADEPGEYVAHLTATDALGNSAERRVPFTIPDEAPSVTLAPTGTAATVEDSSGDLLDVVFAQAQRLELGTEVTVSTGGVADAAAGLADRSGTDVSAAELEAMDTVDGEVFETGDADGHPYVLVEAAVPEGAGDGAQVRVRWEGTASPGSRVTLSVWDVATGQWHEQNHVLAAADGTVALLAHVDVASYAHQGVIIGLVQHGAGYMGADHTTRDSDVTAHHPDDTPRADYDFTLAWESDTQYYNAHAAIHDRQVSIHDYLLKRRDALNLQYLIHTGDIVDQSGDRAQWERADATYSALDEAGLPYGVLAGNHDVNQQTNDYTEYSQWFGRDRFAHQPWYGDDMEDNRGHYDLMSAGGIDFLFVYMGWGARDEHLHWMNQVLEDYPERIGVIVLHEYMLTTGGLGITPQRIHDQVVATNPNVRFVLSGHYHDAYTRTDSFDDDGDGSPDRTVTSMLFDYQDLPNGGDGYMRLMHFDNQAAHITVRTYSDYESNYTAIHPALAAEHQEFTIPYAQAGIAPAPATLTTHVLQVDLLDDAALASFSGVAAGSTVEGLWRADARAGSVGTGWYVRVSDPHGAFVTSEVRDD